MTEEIKGEMAAAGRGCTDVRNNVLGTRLVAKQRGIGGASLPVLAYAREVMVDACESIESMGKALVSDLWASAGK